MAVKGLARLGPVMQLAWLPAPAEVAMTTTDLAADAIYPVAPETSAQLLAAVPIDQTHDIAASIGTGASPLAWWALVLAALWLSNQPARRPAVAWRWCRRCTMPVCRRAP